MDEQKALKLTDPEEILAAAKEAEQRNCESHIIHQLYSNYYAAIERNIKNGTYYRQGRIRK